MLINITLKYDYSYLGQYEYTLRDVTNFIPYFNINKFYLVYINLNQSLENIYCNSIISLE